MSTKGTLAPNTWTVWSWARSLVPPLLGGLIGGTIAFAAFLIVSITYLDLLHEFQTLVSGILAIVASLVVLSGVYATISYDRKKEDNRIKRDAFALSTALLRQAEDMQSEISLVYFRCNLSLKNGSHGSYRFGMERLCEDLRDISVPELFEVPWKDIGLLNPDVGLFINVVRRGLEFAKSMSLSNSLLKTQPVLPGLLNPFEIAVDEAEKERSQNEMKDFLREQVGYYEKMIKPPLDALILYLEAEAEEYATKLGLDEKRKWLRAQAKARRDARKQSGSD